LSRGPALILGTILLAVGLYFIYKQHDFPKFSNFPSGTATVKGKVLFEIFGGNGWTGMLTAVAGGLLLFGAAQHLLAKTMSLIVGVALAAAAILALANHGNVLGLASANHLTELAWGIAAVILLFNTLIPRRTRTIEPAYREGVAERRAGGGRVAAGAAAGAGAGAVAEHEHDKHRAEREAERAPAGERGAQPSAAADQPGAGRQAEAGHQAEAGRQAERQVTNGNAGPQSAERQNATAVQDSGRGGPGPSGRTGSGGQVGLVERARRWLRPGSGN
jgi:hypothetical protein